ncbi:MAG: hypothetical protein ACI4E0_06100 [Blautia sp.]
MHSVIGICDSNTVYMKKLAESFMRKSDIPLQIMTFSDYGQLIEYLMEHNLDVLVIDRAIFEDQFNQEYGVNAGNTIGQQMEVVKQHIRYILELVDGKGGMEKSGDFGFRISRYQSSSELFCLISRLLMRNKITGERIAETVPEYGAGYREKDRCKELFDQAEMSGIRSARDMKEQCDRTEGCIITVYSPVNRCGKTSLAVLLAEFLQRKSISLMVCMDHYSKVFSGEEMNLSELIYCMTRENNFRMEENAFTDFVEYESYVKTWGELLYISAPETVEDLVQVSAAQLCRLMSTLKYRSRYQYIVLDLSEGMENLHKVLEESDVIFMPMLDDCVSRCKIEMFEQHTQSVMGQERWRNLTAKIHKLYLPPAYESGEAENYYRELIWSDQARAAKEILEQYM